MVNRTREGLFATRAEDSKTRVHYNSYSSLVYGIVIRLYFLGDPGDFDMQPFSD